MTKVELEARVAELEVQLAEAKKIVPSDEDVRVQMQTLEENLKQANVAVMELQDTLDKERDAASSEAVQMDQKIQELTANNQGLTETITELTQTINGLKTLEKALDKDNTVYLDGKVYPIIHRNTVKELVQDYHKRYVAEELTAVVIEKHGG